MTLTSILKTLLCSCYIILTFTDPAHLTAASAPETTKYRIIFDVLNGDEEELDRGALIVGTIPIYGNRLLKIGVYETYEERSGGYRLQDSGIFTNMIRPLSPDHSHQDGSRLSCTWSMMLYGVNGISAIELEGRTLEGEDNEVSFKRRHGFYAKWREALAPHLKVEKGECSERYILEGQRINGG